MFKYLFLLAIVTILYNYFILVVKSFSILLLCMILYPQINSKIKLYYKPSVYMDNILSKCPTITGRFFPTPWLFHGIIQLFFGANKAALTKQFSACEPVDYIHEKCSLPDGENIYIHWAVSDDNNTKRLLVVAPGIDVRCDHQNIKTVVVEGIKKGYKVAVITGRGTHEPITVFYK